MILLLQLPSVNMCKPEQMKTSAQVECFNHCDNKTATKFYPNRTLKTATIHNYRTVINEKLNYYYKYLMF